MFRNSSVQSSCCFPKLSCFKTKNKIRSSSEKPMKNSQIIKPSPSLTKIVIQPSGVNSMIISRSLPEIPKLAKSKYISHKSTIVVKFADKFQQQKLMSNVKRQDSIGSLNISKISNASISDNSVFDILHDIVLLEKDKSNEKNWTKKNNVDSCIAGSSCRKTEVPVVVLKNPCFGK